MQDDSGAGVLVSCRVSKVSIGCEFSIGATFQQAVVQSCALKWQ